MINVRCCIACACLVAHSAAGAAILRQSNEDQSWLPNFERQSPGVLPAGVKWGLPLEGGPLRVLCVLPRFVMRDTAMLAQRLDVSVATVAIWDAHRVGRPDDFPLDIPGISTEEVLKQLRTLLNKKTDVVLLAGFDPAILPQEIVDAIGNGVRSGMGLVVVGDLDSAGPAWDSFLADVEPSDGRAEVVRGIGEAFTPEWSAGLDFVHASRAGSGRIVTIDFPGPSPATHALVPAPLEPQNADWEHLDTYLSLIARALRWAAGRDTPIAVERIEHITVPSPEAIEAPPGFPTEVIGGAAERLPSYIFQPYRIHFMSPADRDYAIRSQVRQPGRGLPPIELSPRRLVQRGQNTYDLTVMAGSGEYYLDLWLLHRDKVVEWYTQPIRAEGWPEIRDMAVSKPFVLPQDSITVTFATTPGSRRCSVLARAVDTWGRIVAASSRTVEPQTGLIQLGLNLSDLISDAIKVEVFAVGRDQPGVHEWDTRVCSYAYRLVPVRRTAPRSGFDLVVHCEDVAEYGRRASLERIAELGATAVYARWDERIAPWVARAHLAAIWQVTSYRPTSIENGDKRSPCPSDPVWRAAEREALRSAASSAGRFGSPAFSLGAGNTLALANENVCQTPHCLQSFWSFLRARYGSLENVNARWNTEFETWEEVVPAPESAARLGALEPWIDFRLFMDTVFAELHTDARQTLRGEDGRARVGLWAAAGSGPYDGLDWADLPPRLDFIVAPNDPITTAKALSYRSPGSAVFLEPPKSGAALKSYARWLPWHAALQGASGIVWDRPFGCREQVDPYVLLGPGDTPTPFGQAFLEEVRTLQSGVGRLIRDALVRGSRVAIYSNRSSLFVNHVDTPFACSTPEAERRWIDRVRRLGSSCQFLSKSGLGKLTKTDYPVLILPMARALSDDEVNGVRAYFDSGGAVIADVAPGEFDGHGTRRSDPALDALFGVRHSRPATGRRAAPALVELQNLRTKVLGDLPFVVTDPSVEPVEARVGGVAGGVPVWLMREEADGRLAVLMNHPPTDSLEEDVLLGAVLERAGVAKPVNAATRGDRAFRGESALFEYGPAHVRVLLAEPGGRTQKIAVHLEGKPWTYDVLTPGSPKRKAAYQLELPPARAAVIASLPYAVRQCAVEVPDSIEVGARLPLSVRIEADNGEPGDHLVRIDLVSMREELPRPVPYYAIDLVCRAGRGDAYIPLALNERPGLYRIVARDVLSGVRGEAQVMVSHPSTAP